MFNKTTRCGMVFGLACAGVFGQQVADDGPMPSGPSLIVAVDADDLAKAVFPQSIAAAKQPRFKFPGVERSYQRQDTGESFDLIVGVYPSLEDAKLALMRTTPQFARTIPDHAGDNSFFSARGAHIRVKNVVVLLLLSEKFGDEEQRVGIVLALDAALQDDSIVTYGNVVNTPRVEVIGIDTSRSPYSARYRVIGDGEIILPHRTHRLEAAQYQVDIRQGFYDDEPYLRLARVTGEVLELSLGEIPDALPLPLETLKPRLSAQQRLEFIGKIRAGKSPSSELSVLMHKLSQDGDPELVPFFVEVMASEHPAFVKKFALRGLATIEGKKRLEAYRNYAMDPNQPELIRRDAIRLIGRFGVMEDVQVLMPILDEQTDVLTKAVEDTILDLESR